MVGEIRIYFEGELGHLKCNRRGLGWVTKKCNRIDVRHGANKSVSGGG